MRLLITLLVSIFISVTNTQAEELTILDSNGLIRLSKITAKPISVVFEFECNPLQIEMPTVVLEHEDGLLGDTELPWVSPCQVEAKNIPPGKWKIIFKGVQPYQLIRVAEIRSE